MLQSVFGARPTGIVEFDGPRYGVTGTKEQIQEPHVAHTDSSPNSNDSPAMGVVTITTVHWRCVQQVGKLLRVNDVIT
jgi:hypothetical protein